MKTSEILVLAFTLMILSCTYSEDRMQKNKSVFEAKRGKFEEVLILIKKLRVDKKLNNNFFSNPRCST
jgi:hypothetical protein